jgi:biotin synthase
VIESSIQQILQRVWHAEPLSPTDCLKLLAPHEASIEAAFIRAAGFAVSHRKFGGRGVLLGQIGIESGPCPGGCAFCTFREEVFNEPAGRMSPAEILDRTDQFADGIFALFLMGMHDFNFGFFLESVRAVRNRLSASAQVVVNIGDFDAIQAAELKSAGAAGAYHVLRLREGVDTALDPVARRKTIEAIRTAGMDWYTCCEPIGPEHTLEELCEQIFTGVEMGCFQHAAMRRIALPGTSLARYGQISELRLAQITAVIALATAASKETRSIAVHEPNALGIASGANCVYAESGRNPRDTAVDTAGSRGFDALRCRTMLYEAGYSGLLLADGVTIDNNFSKEGGL